METATERQQHASGASSLAALSSAAVVEGHLTGRGATAAYPNEPALNVAQAIVDANVHFLLTNF